MPPIHSPLGPCIVAVGFAFIVMAVVGNELHDVVLFTNVKVACPGFNPVITPLFVIDATGALLLSHMPPVDGLAFDDVPAHITDGPLIDTTGLGNTVMTALVSDLQPVSVSVNINLPLPADTPVTMPELVIVAIAGHTLSHVPPLLG